MKTKHQMKMWLLSKTMGCRHFIAKLIAPKAYLSVSSFRQRPMIKFLKRTMSTQNLIGVEIGVLTGRNAENILQNLPIKKLYLVDPYQPYFEDGGFMHPENGFFTAKTKLSKFGRKIEFILKKSHDAISEIPNNLDFVYIDGNHSYECIKKDIALYYPKVKSGGIIGGHDFHRRFSGVRKAVLEFTHRENCKLYVKEMDWWIMKL